MHAQLHIISPLKQDLHDAGGMRTPLLGEIHQLGARLSCQQTRFAEPTTENRITQVHIIVWQSTLHEQVNSMQQA
jgi:hypothetical protein